MRWPWASRVEVADVVWSVIPSHGATIYELTRRTGFSARRVGPAMRRLERSGRVTFRYKRYAGTDSAVRVWFRTGPL